MGVIIKKVKSYLPETILTNEQLAKQFERWAPEKIEKKVGIRQRHVSKDGETAGDLAYEAAESVLKDFDRSKIDLLIFCTQSPDYFLPTTACVLQNRLGLEKEIAAFDFNLGCSGYIYGLAIAKSFINSGMAKKVLLLTSETYTKYIHPKDLANKTIFGDGATATILQESPEEHLFEFIFGTDGSGQDNLIVRNGCSRNPFDINAKEITTSSNDIYTDNNLYMNGPEIFNFTIEAVPIAVEQCLNKNNTTIEDIDFIIFHQANIFMINYLRKKIKIPKDKFYANMLNTGNTVSSTIPLALEDALESGKIIKGDKVLLCGFGVGYSWGATIIKV